LVGNDIVRLTVTIPNTTNYDLANRARRCPSEAFGARETGSMIGCGVPQAVYIFTLVVRLVR